MISKKDLYERNIELLEENTKLLKALKKGSEIAQLIKNMAGTSERALELTEKELSVFGEVGDLFESSKSLTESIETMADILVDSHKRCWEAEYNFDLEYPVIDMEED